MLNKLNLGCGNDYRLGFWNVDVSPLVNPDEIVDLEKPLTTFKTNSVEVIVCNHTLEHIHNLVPLIHELHRVCINGAAIYIRVPFYASWGQWNDPTHVRFFSPFSFEYFKAGNYSHEVLCDKDMFKVKARINFAIGRLKFMNFIMNPLLNLNQKFYCRFFAFIIPASEIYFELEVLK
jgi:SAM-dependent methyltransferase